MYKRIGRDICIHKNPQPNHRKITIEEKVWLLFLKVNFMFGSFSAVRRYSANQKSICIETTTVHVQYKRYGMSL